MRIGWQRIEREWGEHLDTAVVEEIKKRFGFNCELLYVGKEWFGGSEMWVYRFLDPLGVKWSYDLNSRMFWDIVNESPKALSKYDFMRNRYPKTTIRVVYNETKEMNKKQCIQYIKRCFKFESKQKCDRFIQSVMGLRG